ncbi:cytochrome c, partial [Salinisphaera sp. USBA-960]|nr:cytochrome c [Salifodinibacter halophilus]
MLEYARERSIAVRAQALTVPANLDDAERVRRGAGNYAAMCAGCHLSPGAGPSELAL